MRHDNCVRNENTRNQNGRGVARNGTVEKSQEKQVRCYSHIIRTKDISLTNFSSLHEHSVDEHVRDHCRSEDYRRKKSEF